MPRSTNEWEFQGEVLSWCNEELNNRSGLGFGRASQEFPNKQGHRSDIVVWEDHAARIAVLEIELKNPSTPLRNAQFQKDAISKAQKVKAPYVALWNMRNLALYRTPEYPRTAFLASDLIKDFDSLTYIKDPEDWLKPKTKEALQGHALSLLLSIHDLVTRGAIGGAIIDATVFVEFLTERVRRLRGLLHEDFQHGLARDKRLRGEILSWAAAQGLSQFVEDVEESLAAQLAYRIVGQALFYHAFRRQERALPSLAIDESTAVSTQLRAYWDSVRSFDYEALYEESPIERVPIRSKANHEIGVLINELARYDWDDIRIDVLGSIFEQLIPEPERIVLGQYYTPPRLADVIVSLAHDAPDKTVLDPAVGTGTFLYRAHSRLTARFKTAHEENLQHLWGFDISAFPTELAVINLCRLDLSSRSNFPRLAVRDFFDVNVGDKLLFPPAKRNPGSTARVEVAIPSFDVVVGNPPYVRSQQLDDLDPRVKTKLRAIAELGGVKDAKFDLFAYFIVKARGLLKPGGQLAFVTSAAWLTAKYGAVLQRFMLEHFRVKMILWSAVEPFFPAVEVDTIVVLLESLSEHERKLSRGSIRFATLSKSLGTILPNSADKEYWRRVDELTSLLSASPIGVHDHFVINEVDADNELTALRADPKRLRNWAKWCRMSPTYAELFGG